MIVNYGKNQAARAISEGLDLSDWRTFKFGTTGDATTLTDTGLKAQISGAQGAGTVVRTDNKLAFSAQWTNNSGSSKTVREFGVFDVGGYMVARVATGDGAFEEVVIGAGQTLYVDTYDVYVKDASEV